MTQFELRDKLGKDIMEMEDHLLIEQNPNVNSVILSKCTLDNKIYRAKVSRKSAENHEKSCMTLDCFDYAEQIEVEQKDGQWFLVNNEDITFTFYKYPLNLKHYPIMTFGIKING